MRRSVGLVQNGRKSIFPWQFNLSVISTHSLSKSKTLRSFRSRFIRLVASFLPSPYHYAPLEDLFPCPRTSPYYLNILILHQCYADTLSNSKSKLRIRGVDVCLQPNLRELPLMYGYRHFGHTQERNERLSWYVFPPIFL
jgi:hypothetical protein